MSTALATFPPTGDFATQEYRPLPTGGVAVIDAMQQLNSIRTFVAKEFKQDLDYGVIPGTGTKPAMLLPGAQKVAMFLDAFPTYDVEARELGSGHVEYIVTTTLVSRGSQRPIGTGLGSCSTMEDKYRFRNAARKCPECGQAAIIVGKEEYGGGYVCFKKKGGCGAKFREGDKSIEGQAVGKVENASIYDTRNTVLKIAKKRSQVDASIGLACLADLYTQDVDEDIDNAIRHAAEEQHAPPRASAPERADAGRRAVNEEFRPEPEPARPSKPKAATMDEYLNQAVDDDDFLRRVDRYLAKLCPDRDKTARELALINRVISDATEAAANGHLDGFDPRSVLKPAQAGKDAARDPSKAAKEFRRLLAQQPSWFFDVCVAYIDEKREAARREALAN